MDRHITSGVARCFLEATGYRITATKERVPVKEHQLKDLPGVNIETFYQFLNELSEFFDVDVDDIQDTWTLQQLLDAVNRRFYGLD